MKRSILFLLAALCWGCDSPLIELPDRLCPGPAVSTTGLGDPRGLIVGRSYTIGVTACEAAVPRPLRVSFTVADTSIASVTIITDSTATLRAKRAGETDFTVRVINFGGDIFRIRVNSQ